MEGTSDAPALELCRPAGSLPVVVHAREQVPAVLAPWVVTRGRRSARDASLRTFAPDKIRLFQLPMFDEVRNVSIRERSALLIVSSKVPPFLL